MTGNPKFYLAKFIILLILNQVYQINCIKRELINFQVYEEGNAYKSKLNVKSLIDVNSELKLTSKTEKEEIYNGLIDMRLPFPLKMDGKLRKIKDSLNEFKNNQSTDKATALNDDSTTLYRLNLNIEGHSKLDLVMNHTIKDKTHQFVSEVDVNLIESNLAGKYLGTLRYNENGCPKLTLYHNFTSKVSVASNILDLINFSSNLTENCNQLNSMNEMEDEMKITIDFNNLINDLFNFKLDQVFLKQANKGNEVMNLFSRIYQIEVLGNHEYLNETLVGNNQVPTNSNYHSTKRAIFTSNLPNEFPTFEVKYSFNDKSKNKMKLSLGVKNSFYTPSKKENKKKQEL